VNCLEFGFRVSLCFNEGQFICVSISYFVLCVFPFSYSLVVSTSAIDCLERLVSKVINYVFEWDVNPAHSLTHSLTTSSSVATYRRTDRIASGAASNRHPHPTIKPQHYQLFTTVLQIISAVTNHTITPRHMLSCYLLPEQCDFVNKLCRANKYELFLARTQPYQNSCSPHCVSKFRQ